MTQATVPSQLATYVLVESRDPLELTVTPQAINVLKEVRIAADGHRGAATKRGEWAGWRAARVLMNHSV